MKKLYLYISILALSLLASCETEVDMDLNTAEPKLVIDAAIKDDSVCTVRLTISKGVKDKDIPYEKVTGAQIKLTDKTNNSEYLTEISPGEYVSSMVGVIDMEYILDVTVDSETYSASAIIPRLVPIDSAYTYNIQPGDDPNYSPCVVFNDPPMIDNYYYGIVYINGSRLRTLYVVDDQYRDGLKMEMIMGYDKEDNDDYELKIGDVISVEAQCIDKGTYTYFNSISNSITGGGNPISKFTGDVLGNFKAYTSSSIEFTIAKDNIHTP